MRANGQLFGAAALTLLVSVGLPVTKAQAADEAFTCRRAAGREGTRFLRKAAALASKCREQRLRAPQITCPQAADESRLERARERVHSGISQACSGDLPTELVGDCPSPCTASVTDAGSLADCVVCFAEASLGDFMNLVFPDPPEPGGICGDGLTGTSEECDPPEDDACPGRCGAPGGPDACECQPVESCSFVTQPPGTCTTDNDCPPEYTCAGGQCEAGICEVRAHCPSDGQCVHIAGAPDGICICRGCGPDDCPLGCTAGNIGGLLITNGCICNELDDCPPEDDVCYLGICS